LCWHDRWLFACHISKKRVNQKNKFCREIISKKITGVNGKLTYFTGGKILLIS
jgi:hypothetical protein